MSSELKQTAAEALSSPAVQKTVTGITTVSGVTLVFNVIPYVLGITATTVGIMASWAIYRERRTKSRLNELMIEQEIERQAEVEERRDKGLDLRREHDK